MGQDRTGDIIVGYNWCILLCRVLIFVPVALLLTGSQALSGLMSMVTVIFAFILFWGTIRRVLPGVEAPVVAGLLVALLVMTILVSMAFAPLFTMIELPAPILSPPIE